MPLNLFQGKFLSQNFLRQEFFGEMGLLENQETPIGALNCLPFEQMDGDTLRMERAGKANYTVGDGPKFNIPPLNPTPRADAVPEPLLEAKFSTTLMAQMLKLSNFIDMNMSSQVSQLGTQLQAVQKQFVYNYARTMARGNTAFNPAEFNGLPALTTAAQTIQASDTVDFHLTMNDMARLESKLKSCEGYPSVYYCNTEGLLNFKQAHYDAGLEVQMCPMSQCMGGGTQGPLITGDPDHLVPCYNGAPVLVNDFIRNDRQLGTMSGGCAIWVACLGAPYGLFGIVPASQPNITVRQVLDPSMSYTNYLVEWASGLAVGRQTSVGMIEFMSST